MQIQILKNLGLACLISVGSLSLYCGGEVADELLGDGGVAGDAHAAEACEVAVPTRTSLQEGSLASGQLGAPVDVSAYAGVVLYVTGSCATSVRIFFTHEIDDDAAATVNLVEGGATPVLGNFAHVAGGACTSSYRLVGQL